MGRFTRKIQRQPTVSVRSPPSTGPDAGASTVGMVRMADARARCSGGKARNSSVIPTGVSMPPPIPCRIRNATSWPIERDSEHSTDAVMNMTRAKMKVRLVPKRSPTQPEIGIHTARDRE